MRGKQACLLLHPCQPGENQYLEHKAKPMEDPMDLGAFSTSLAVKDLAASKAFYEKLGFSQRGGDMTQNWVVMKSGDIVIGLFQGMFDRNILTFSPGWDQDAKELKDFQDVREIQKTLKARGVALLTEADETSKGPAHFTLQDPDGNQILFDQYV
jgi:lactoylglutathione lyase